MTLGGLSTGCCMLICCMLIHSSRSLTHAYPLRRHVYPLSAKANTPLHICPDDLGSYSTIRMTARPLWLCESVKELGPFQVAPDEAPGPPAGIYNLHLWATALPQVQPHGDFSSDAQSETVPLDPHVRSTKRILKSGLKAESNYSPSRHALKRTLTVPRHESLGVKEIQGTTRNYTSKITRITKWE